MVSAPRKDERTGADCITVSGLSTTGAQVSLAAGKVAELTFKALDTAELGEASFTVTTQALPQYEDPTQAVELTVVNDANITIGEAAAGMQGDVNGDGKLSTLDLSKLRKHLANSSIEINVNNADINADGKISSLDLSKLRKLLAAGK